MLLQIKGRQRYSFKLFARTMLAFTMAALAMSCTDKEVVNPVPTANTPPAAPAGTPDSTTGKKYLALGDSYTIGQNVAEAGRFPMQLAAKISAGGIPVAKPDIIAVTGWTTTNLLNAIAAAKPASNYDIVTLLIGVNDQYQTHDTSGYRSRFTACLQKAIAAAGGNKERVFVLSIPDYSVTPFGQNGNVAETAMQIDQFNVINKAETEAFGISYTDVTAISRQAKDDQSLTAGDGLHPSEKQYSLWVGKLLGTVEPRLK